MRLIDTETMYLFTDVNDVEEAIKKVPTIKTIYGYDIHDIVQYCRLMTLMDISPQNFHDALHSVQATMDTKNLNIAKPVIMPLIAGLDYDVPEDYYETH